LVYDRAVTWRPEIMKNYAPPQKPGTCRQSSNWKTIRLMDAGVVPELYDLVFDVEFSPFEFCNFQIVGGGVGECFVDFLFKCLVPFFKFRKMLFDRHKALLLASMTPNPEPNTVQHTPFARYRKSRLCGLVGR